VQQAHFSVTPRETKDIQLQREEASVDNTLRAEAHPISLMIHLLHYS